MARGFTGSRGAISAATAQGLRDASYSWVRPGVVLDHFGGVYYAPRLEAVNSVISGVRLAVYLLRNNELPYRVMGTDDGEDVFDSTHLVEKLKWLTGNELREMWLHLSDYEVHPYLRLLSMLINALNGSVTDSWPRTMNSAHPSSQDPELASAWNQLVLDFREKVKERKLEASRQLMVRTANKNARGCKDYINGLRKISKDLYVQRLELSYKPETQCTPGSIKDDLATLLRSRNQRRFEKSWYGLTGYVWRLERGDLNWKVHLVLFFDGRIVTTPKQAEMIASIWMQGLNKVGHIAYLLQAKPVNYQLCAIGLMKRGEPDADRQLKMLVHYMTKLDAVMRLSIQEDPRFVTYSRGQLPRNKPKPSTQKKQEPTAVKSTTYHGLPIYMGKDSRLKSDPWRALFPSFNARRRGKKHVIECNHSGSKPDAETVSSEPNEVPGHQKMEPSLPVLPQVGNPPRPSGVREVNGVKVQIRKKRVKIST